jgi:hypothetical protein
MFAYNTSQIDHHSSRLVTFLKRNNKILWCHHVVCLLFNYWTSDWFSRNLLWSLCQYGAPKSRQLPFVQWLTTTWRRCELVKRKRQRPPEGMLETHGTFYMAICLENVKQQNNWHVKIVSNFGFMAVNNKPLKPRVSRISFLRYEWLRIKLRSSH